MPAQNFFLCSLEKNKTSPLLTWWRPECRGYTNNLDAAGLYPEHEARRLVSPTSFAVPERIAIDLAEGDAKIVMRSHMETLKAHKKVIRHGSDD